MRAFGLEGWIERLLQSDSSISRVRREALHAHKSPPDLEGLGLVGLAQCPIDGPHVQEPSILDCAASVGRLVQDFQGPRPRARIIFYLLLPYSLEAPPLPVPLQPWPPYPQPEQVNPQLLHELAKILIWPQKSWLRHEPPSILYHPIS